MPYLNGKRVSNDEYIAAKTGESVGWKDAFGYTDGPAAEPEPEPEATKPERKSRSRSKKQQVESALTQITGLDIDLGDDSEEEDK